VTALHRAVTDALPVAALPVRTGLLDLPRTHESHRAAMAALPAMQMVEFRPGPTAGPLAFPFTVGAWNLERCLSPDASAQVLRREGVSVALLSELDQGMARTAQRDTCAALAAPLGLASAYAVEFLELDLGNAVERAFCVDRSNARGFHGNALLAPFLAHPFLVRLDDHGHWFRAASPEPRIGGRCAVGGWLRTEGGPILAVSAHMESDATGDERGEAFAALLDVAEAEARGGPIILGGDLNTFGSDGDWRAEPLLAIAAGRGFAIHGGGEGTTTRPSRITLSPPRAYKLDWIMTRGLATSAGAIVPALDPDGLVLSDHDLVTLTVTGIL
jgi:endonuclease/exonuclease/phosphatase family metal-dependent hydrolase